jgi:hypothetical protein
MHSVSVSTSLPPWSFRGELELRTAYVEYLQNCQDTRIFHTFWFKRYLHTITMRMSGVLLLLVVVAACGSQPPGPMDGNYEIQSTQELVESAVKALVEHYRDPIHEEEEESCSVDEECEHGDRDVGQIEEVETTQVPPVVAFQLRRLLEFGSSEAATAPARIRDVWRHLVDSYQSHVRPTLFGSAGRRTAPRVAVVTHYQLLTSLYFRRNADVLLDTGVATQTSCHHPSTLEDDNKMQDDCEHDLAENSQVAALERLACDVTLATAIEVRRKKKSDPIHRRRQQISTRMDAEGKGCEKDDDAPDDDNDKTVDPAATNRILVALIRHMTCVWRCVVLTAQKRNSQVQHTTASTTRAVVRHIQAQTNVDRVALRCACALLSFDWDPASMLGIDSGCCYYGKSDAEDQASAAAVGAAASSSTWSPDSLHCLPMTLAPKGRDAFLHLSVRNEIDWNSLLELQGSVWAPPRGNHSGGGAPTELRNAVRDFWLCWSEYDQRQSLTRIDEGAGRNRDPREFFRRWDAEALAKAVRAHFFGRDMVADPAAEMVARHQTRLHLGKTVRYVPDPDVTQKPHLQVPSRVVAVLHWMSMLSPEQFTEPVWVELLPILYELLSGASYVLNGWGAVVVYRLVPLHDGTNDTFLASEQSETSIRNLLLMLHTIAKTCREGPVLAVAGTAYCRLLRLLSKRHASEASQQRRVATQHWLTVLYQNETRASTHPSLILGLLTGAAQLLHDQVECNGANAADGLEVGRLGLSALLPLLVHDDAFLGLETGQNTSACNNTSDGMRLAALVALNNLMIAAYPIVPRHTGKILSHLLRTCAELQQSSEAGNDANGVGDRTGKALRVDEGKRLQHVALHVASTALVLCGEKGNVFLQRLENDDGAAYSKYFLSVVEDVRECARTLLPAPKSFEPTHSQGLIQVL